MAQKTIIYCVQCQSSTVSQQQKESGEQNMKVAATDDWNDQLPVQEFFFIHVDVGNWFSL